MRYLSVCSGIEAASVAWHPLGWKPVAFSEIEAFPSSVLSHRFPDVPNLGDMTKFKEWKIGPVDLLVGGTPCQSFSVAGLRKGLTDPRGNLMLTYGAIADRFKPRWIVWENVPGVLSSNGGRDFGTFLGMLGELGYGVAYRVLDAQFFGVPQRRRRVFVVGCLGDWRAAAAVLFESESLRGYPPPSRTPGKGITHDLAPCLTSSGRGVERGGDTRGQDPVAACFDMRGNGDGDTVPTITGDHAGRPTDYTPVVLSQGYFGNAEGGAEDVPFITRSNIGKCVNNPTPLIGVAHTLRGRGFDASEDGTGRGTPIVPVTVGALSANGGTSKKHGFGMGQQDWENGYAIPVAIQDIRGMDKKQNGKGWNDDGTAYTVDAMATQGVAVPSTLPVAWTEELTASVNVAGTIQRGGQGGRHDGVMTDTAAVRRLTPRECERLQGFPDDWTLIEWYECCGLRFPYALGKYGCPNCKGDKTARLKQSPDGSRYKACGNSMAVPVMAWIGRRIEKTEALISGKV